MLFVDNCPTKSGHAVFTDLLELYKCTPKTIVLFSLIQSSRGSQSDKFVITGINENVGLIALRFIKQSLDLCGPLFEVSKKVIFEENGCQVFSLKNKTKNPYPLLG